MLPDRDSYTSEQITDRWGVDVDYVNHLIFSRKLPRALLLSGPAKLFLRNASGRYEEHPDTADGAIRTSALIVVADGMSEPGSWPLRYIRRVYEFLSKGQQRREVLERYSEDARIHQLDWKIEFSMCHTKVMGDDHHLVALEDLLEFESTYDIPIKTEKEQRQSSQGRDPRRHRSRAIAQVLWERDASATLPDVYKHEWIQRIACEGKPPTEKTFREWVKDLNPDRSPGRRPS